VEVAIVSDAEISRVHEDFMGIPGPTDVITFQHGEILIGVDTALANSVVHGKSLDREIALYVVHGLLHLNGWSDKDPDEARRMEMLQEKLLNRILIP